MGNREKHAASLHYPVQIINKKIMPSQKCKSFAKRFTLARKRFTLARKVHPQVSSEIIFGFQFNSGQQDKRNSQISLTTTSSLIRSPLSVIPLCRTMFRRCSPRFRSPNSQFHKTKQALKATSFLVQSFLSIRQFLHASPPLHNSMSLQMTSAPDSVCVCVSNPRRVILPFLWPPTFDSEEKNAPEDSSTESLSSSCWELDPTLCLSSSQKMESKIDRFIES